MNHLVFVTLAQAAGGNAAPQQSPLGMLIPFACIAVIFYFLIIRPQAKRQKEQEFMVKSLKTGDKVITNGGIHGLISNVKDNTVILKVADNVKIEVDKVAIVTVSKREDESPKA